MTFHDVLPFIWQKDVSSLLVLTDEEKLKLLKAELLASLPLLENTNGVVFNLFACELWFVAAHRGIPCVCASSFFPSRYETTVVPWFATHIILFVRLI